MLKLPFELLNARQIQGRKDPTRWFTIVDGLVTLPSGMRAYCEAFLPDRKTFQPGPHVLEVEVRVNQDRRITASPTTCYPRTEKAAA